MAMVDCRRAGGDVGRNYFERLACASRENNRGIYMMERRLQNQLGALEAMLRRARLWRRLAFCWAATAVAELLLFLIYGITGWDTRLLWWLVLIGGLTAAGIVWGREGGGPA